MIVHCRFQILMANWSPWKTRLESKDQHQFDLFFIYFLLFFSILTISAIKNCYVRVTLLTLNIPNTPSHALGNSSHSITNTFFYEIPVHYDCIQINKYIKWNYKNRMSNFKKARALSNYQGVCTNEAQMIETILDPQFDMGRATVSTAPPKRSHRWRGVQTKHKRLRPLSTPSST